MLHPTSYVENISLTIDSLEKVPDLLFWWFNELSTNENVLVII